MAQATLERDADQTEGQADGWHFARLATLVVTLAILLGIAHGLTTSVAEAYSCSTHCEAGNDWLGGPINGASTDISVVHLTCNCTGGTFIYNAIWLNDTSNPNQTYWIEQGYTMPYNGGQEWYYWGDCRPRDPEVRTAQTTITLSRFLMGITAIVPTSALTDPAPPLLMSISSVTLPHSITPPKITR